MMYAAAFAASSKPERTRSMETVMDSKYYENLPDEEVVGRARDGEHTAVDYLMEKYKNLVRKKARTMFLVGGDTDDLIQEGMIGLYRAIRDYNEDKQASFQTFANLCIVRQIYSAIKASNRQKNIPLNTYISIYATVTDEQGNAIGENFLLDEIMDLTGESPEDIVIDRENVAHMEKIFKDSLSKLEEKVLNLYLNGMTYTQIAEIMGRTPKSIDNALQRIKGKLAVVQQ